MSDKTQNNGVEVSVDMQEEASQDWYSEYAREWAVELDSKERTAQRIVYFWKFMSFLPVPVGMVAWVFGALDLQKQPQQQQPQPLGDYEGSSIESDGIILFNNSNVAATSSSSSTASGIALMVVGGVMVFLDRLKPRKYLVAAKKQLVVYREASQYLHLQAALPPSQRAGAEVAQATVLALLREDVDNKGSSSVIIRDTTRALKFPK